MKRTNYQAPEAQIIRFETEDITLSTVAPVQNGGTDVGTGGKLDIFP